MLGGRPLPHHVRLPQRGSQSWNPTLTALPPAGDPAAAASGFQRPSALPLPRLSGTGPGSSGPYSLPPLLLQAGFCRLFPFLIPLPIPFPLPPSHQLPLTIVHICCLCRGGGSNPGSFVLHGWRGASPGASVSNRTRGSFPRGSRNLLEASAGCSWQSHRTRWLLVTFLSLARHPGPPLWSDRLPACALNVGDTTGHSRTPRSQ